MNEEKFIMIYKISDYVEVKDIGNAFLISYRNVLKISKNPISSKVIELLCTTGIDTTEELSKTRVFQILLKFHFVHHVTEVSERDNFNPRTEYYFENYFSNPKQIMEKLSKQKICIIGLGGTGTQILQYLCGVGISDYLLVDFDRVEESNLNRQFLYSYKDVGKLKIDVCENYIYAHLKKSRVKKFQLKVNSVKQFKDIFKDYIPSLIVCAADKPQDKIQKIIYSWADKLKVPSINGGVGPDIASYSFKNITRNGKNSNGKNTNKVLHKRQVTYGSFGPTNGILAAMMAHDVIMKLINGNMLGRDDQEVVIDFRNSKLLRLNLNE